MFTGIISDVGTITSVISGGVTRYQIKTAYGLTGVAIGASIACSGACHTVVEKGEGWFAVESSAETLSKTSLGNWTAGTPVNLERPLTPTDELGGHMVSGHVDGVGTVLSFIPDGDCKRFTFTVPDDLMRFIAPKGSITVDGVSLTVNEVGPDSFGVNIIPHTEANTTFGGFAVGDMVNLEIDLVARYVARLLEKDNA
jgi:riboflavin synthase